MLAPGSSSAHRHWHEKEDEFVYVVDGELTLIDDAGEHVLTPGMCAGFKAGLANGHHLVNETADDVVYLEVGDRTPGDEGSYPDDDLKVLKSPDGLSRTLVHKDGTPY